MFNRFLVTLIVLSFSITVGCEATQKSQPKPKQTVAKKVKAKTSPAKAKPRVFFVSPKDGAKVGTTLDVEFGLEGMGISPAGKAVKDKTKGHHHLIIDGAPIGYGGVVPMNATHLHFGKGQTKTKIQLTPGKHTLTMQFADGMHKSFGDGLSATITVEASGPVPKPAPTSAPTSAPTK
jgi:hypothetical protein